MTEIEFTYINKTKRIEGDFSNQGIVRNHHSHGSEQSLQSEKKPNRVYKVITGTMRCCSETSAVIIHIRESMIGAVDKRSPQSYLCDPGSISRTRRLMWIEFVVGSRLAPRVFLRFSSIHKKPTLVNCKSIWTSGRPLIAILATEGVTLLKYRLLEIDYYTHLEIVRELGPASITGIHSDKCCTGWVEFQFCSFKQEGI